MVEIKSFNQILGNMVRKIVAETPLSDIHPGSVLLSLLEACASNDFENNVAILNVLELLSIDSLRGSDLDNRAADFGLARKPAVAATGTVSFYNTNIKKQSTSLYSLKPAPIAGQTVLFVTNTQGWAPTGTLYIGRGTASFEGPIAYVSIERKATYSQITLASALQKDHLLSDTVINAQGQPDRRIPAGTIVKIPANNQNAEISYATLREAVIPAGEDRVDGVLTVAQVPGKRGNALVNTIRLFNAVPFAGAAVVNTQAFTSGSDAETDEQLRNRLKSYTASLARGTSSSILSAIIGLSDPDENKRVVSAIMSNPVKAGDPSILYIDDGGGFQPSYAGQAVDTLIANANGTEEFLQLANFPLPRPQVVNTVSGPFLMANQMFLRVLVDNEEDIVVFTSSDFANISAATVFEVLAAINAKSTIFKARLDNSSNNILLYPVNPDAETIQVPPPRKEDDVNLYANNVLNFPTNEISYIALYKNNVRLKQQEREAAVVTTPFATWNLLFDGNLVLSVDGTPPQDVSFELADFPGQASYALLSLSDWVDAINKKFAGVTAKATSSETMLIASNKKGSKASIKIIGGTYQASMFGSNAVEATGQESQFEINRQTGNVRILSKIEKGDTVSAGTLDTKGYVLSAPTPNGRFNLSVDDSGRNSELVIVLDAEECNPVAVSAQVGDTLTISSTDEVMRVVASNTSMFRNVQPGHYIYFAFRNNSTWLSKENTGLFKVVRRGPHLTAGTDSWIEVHNASAVPETAVLLDVDDVVAFATDAYPQVWDASERLESLDVVPITDLALSLNNHISGIQASIFRTNMIKLSSMTEVDGSVAVPVSTGRIATVIPATTKAQGNNFPLIAHKTTAKDLIGFPRIADINAASYLSRSAYSLMSGRVEAGESSTEGETITSDVFTGDVNLSDALSLTDGSNKGLTYPINSITEVEEDKFQIETQPTLPHTAFDYVPDVDEVTLFNSLSFNEDDVLSVVLDGDANAKTININLARTGRVNAGNNSETFIPTSSEFSAFDEDNEDGINFSTLNVWGTDVNNTDFADYAVLMRARNWYAPSTGGKFLVRSTEYGPNGNNMRFSIKYPTKPKEQPKVLLTENPTYSELSYYFGSSPERQIDSSVTEVQISGPFINASDESVDDSWSPSDGKVYAYWDLKFNANFLEEVEAGDVLSINNSTLNVLSKVFAASADTVRVYAHLEEGTHPVAKSTVKVYGLTGTATGDIVDVINTSNILEATLLGPADEVIDKSTDDEVGLAAHGYQEEDAYISLFDGINWVKSFQNANPNFSLKNSLTLISNPSIYKIHTALNNDGALGEYFKLVPTTTKNLWHHLTQRAISQLPILSNVKIVNKGKRIQITSKQLGSDGEVKILGGGANQAQTDLLGDSKVVPLASNPDAKFLHVKVSGFPNSYRAGDIVKLQNRAGVRRNSSLGSNSAISTVYDGSTFVDYLWEPRLTNINGDTQFSISDVSASEYSMEPGMVFRWTLYKDSTETLANVQVGDIVAAYNLNTWNQANVARIAGDGKVSGFPIIKVNNEENYFDVVYPFSEEMPKTPVGLGTVKIFPTHQIRWNLPHRAPLEIASIEYNDNNVYVTCFNEHNLKEEDVFQVVGSNILPDGQYQVDEVPSITELVFQLNGSDQFEPAVGAKLLPLNRTKYRLDTLGINNLARITVTGGASPRFADAGVAVDDYIIISGSTFSNANRGTFRVVAVDNDSVIFENPSAVEDRNTLIPFNELQLAVQWTANSFTVNGAAGAFKNLKNGVWVKKEEDEGNYLQVIACNTGNFATATSITLGGVYTGVSGTAMGVSYDQETGYDGGVLLKNVDDIVIYEGDSTLPGDTLHIQDRSSGRTFDWFAKNNTGTFQIIAAGCNSSDHRPFVRVKNTRGSSETVNVGQNLDGFYINESNANKFYSYRLISNSSVDAFNPLRRSLYMLPSNRSYKFTEANGTFVTHMGKLGFDLNTSTGTDGYLYYTGLLRRAQRTVDGFAPDAVNFPERRAVGSRIEVLPSLVKNLSMGLNITTNQGVTLQDVEGSVRSTIIDYVNNLGVGQDVILSAIIAKVMQIRGIAAATFTTPTANQERISIAANEKAVIMANNIGIG